jgi:hypothetical protein
MAQPAKRARTAASERAARERVAHVPPAHLELVAAEIPDHFVLLPPFAPFVGCEPSDAFEAWLDQMRPSAFPDWLVAENPRAYQGAMAVPLPTEAQIVRMRSAWASAPRKTGAVALEIARAHSCKGGKWLIYVPTAAVDDVWARVARSLMCGELGRAAKVGRMGDAGESHVICVYAPDFDDRAELDRLRGALRTLGFNKPLSFKPDVFTYLDIYAKNPWGIQPTIRRA